MQVDTVTTPSGSPSRRRLQAAFNAMAAIGTVWIFAIMLLIVADVVGRNFFGSPITGVAEIAARSVVAIVFLMLPAAVLSETLIRADFLLRILRDHSGRATHLLDMSFALIGAILFALVALAAWPDTAVAWRTSEFFGVRGVWTLPALPFRLIVVFGSAASALAFAVCAFGSLASIRNSKAK